MTQRPSGRGSGIIAAKSYFMLVKWLVPVNKNMITKAPRPASLQEESLSTPSKPTPRRMMNETRRTNKDAMCLLSARAGCSALRLCCGPLRVAYFSVRFLSVYRPFLLAKGSCSLASLLHLLLLSGRSWPYVLVLSLRPGAALNHPHFSCTTPALRLQKHR